MERGRVSKGVFGWNRGWAALLLAAGLSCAGEARTLVHYTMENDAADGVITGDTTFGNAASAANAFFGRLGPGSQYNNHLQYLPVATNGFEAPFRLRDGIAGEDRENARAIHFPSDPDVQGDNRYGCGLYPDDPEGKLNLQSFTIEFFFRTKKWTNWHGLIVKPFWNAKTSARTNTLALIEKSYSRTTTGLSLQYAYRDEEGVVHPVDLDYVYRGSTPCIQDGAWHHLALTLDQKTHMARLYLDRDLKWSGTLLGDLAYTDDPGVGIWNFGGDPKGDWAWGGTLDEVRISDRALDPSEFLIRTDGDRSADTFWSREGGGAWGEAANWTKGVPEAGATGWIARDTAAPLVVGVSGAAPVEGDVYVRNLTATTTVEVAGAASARNARLSFLEGGRLCLEPGASFALTGSTIGLLPGAFCDVPAGARVLSDGEGTQAGGLRVASGGEVQVRGTLALTNQEAQVVNQGTVVVEDGDVAVLADAEKADVALRNEGDLLLRGEASLCVGASAYKTRSGAQLRLSGSGRVVCSGASCLTLTNHMPDLRAGVYRFTDAAALRIVSGTKDATFALNHVDGGKALEMTFEDDSEMSFLAGNVTLQVGGSANGVNVLNWRSSKTQVCNCGLYLGVGTDTSRLNISRGQMRVGGHQTRIGQLGGGRRAAPKGFVSVTGGSLVNASSWTYSTSPNGIVVGRGIDGASDEPGWAFGELSVSGEGAVTNENNRSYFWVGLSRAEGHVRQSGGEIVHLSPDWEMALGLWGGKGFWTISNGVTQAAADVYVGGFPTDVLYRHAEVGYADPLPESWFATNHTAEGVLTVAGGAFTAAKALVVSADGRGTLAVGPHGLIQARTVALSNTVDAASGARYAGVARVVAGADGVGQIAATEDLVVAEGAVLEADLSALAATATAWYPLLTAQGEVKGAFAESLVLFTPPAVGPRRGALWYGTRAGRTGYWFHNVRRGTVLLVR